MGNYILHPHMHSAMSSTPPSTSAKRLLAQDNQAIQSLQSRLDNLERLLAGGQPSTTTAAGDPDALQLPAPPGGLPDMNLLSTLARIQVNLSNAKAQSPEFLEATTQIDRAFNLLIQHAKDPVQVAALAGDAVTLNQWLAHHDAAQVPVAAKAALVETAELDMRAAASDLERIDNMDNMLSQTQFKDLPTASLELAKLDHQARAVDQQVREIEAQVVHIMDVYGAYVDQLSEIFVQLDEQVRLAERTVTALEAKKRREQDE
ncbi:hypothetical protein BCR44DRAFT_90804, partial [Catenaria anguillulae PL171]